MKTYTYGLCEGRHHSPASEGIFPREIREFRTDLLEKRADERIPHDCEKLELYVSGFAMALLAVVKVCYRRGIHLTAYNYNPTYKMYTREEIF